VVAANDFYLFLELIDDLELLILFFLIFVFQLLARLYLFELIGYSFLYELRDDYIQFL